MKVTLEDAYGTFVQDRTLVHAFLTAHPTICAGIAFVAGLIVRSLL